MTTRLNLGAALVARPQILLLDEPVASLDPLGRADILDLLRALAGQTTVVVSSHDLSGVEELCTVLGVLVGGRLLFQGRTSDLLTSVSDDRWLVEVRPPAATVLAMLSAAPWVSQVKETAPGRIELHAPAADQVESHLSRLLADAGARVVALSPVRPSLDEAFLALTAAPRDEGRS
jgi:ABC-2 type transport system ATP-binding protein